MKDKDIATRLLLALALLYTLYFARTLLMPVIVALLFALLLSPLVKTLKRFYVPRTVSAILLLCLIGGPIALLMSQLVEPAQRWAEAIPELTEKLSQQVDDLTDKLSPEPVKPPEPEDSGFLGLFGDGDESEKQGDADGGGDRVSDRLKQSGLELLVTTLGAAPVLIAQLLTTVMLMLFLLIFGSRLFESFVYSYPGIQDKEHSLELVHELQVELSRYIVTVSIINACLGLATALALWLLGVQDPLLWGVLVALLNFAPYVGPLIGVILLTLVGVVQFGPVLTALVPAAVYFAINMLEAQFVTPMVLGRHMRLNPLVIILWLLLWGWLWGAVGVLLAVPLLVCLKLAAGQTNYLRHWVDLVETRA